MPMRAYKVAHMMALNLMQTPEPTLLRCRFEVRDSAGEIVVELPFSEAISIPGRLN